MSFHGRLVKLLSCSLKCYVQARRSNVLQGVRLMEVLGEVGAR